MLGLSFLPLLGLHLRAPTPTAPRVSHITLQAPSFITEVVDQASPSVAHVMSDDTIVGSACALSLDSVCYMLTSAIVVGGQPTVELAMPGGARQTAKVVGTAPEVDLALLTLPEDVKAPPFSLGNSTALGEGDFLIALGAPSAANGGASLGLFSSRATMPSLAPSSDDGTPARVPPPGTAEAAMAEAEAAAEVDALQRGEQPFVVASAAATDGFLRGSPLLTADGELVGLNSLALAELEGDSTRYYAVTVERAARALDAMVGRLSLGEKVNGARVVLFNDAINKRENVQTVLAAAGLSDSAASLAMQSAHKTGRGTIGYFDTQEEAEALVKKIWELGKELPSALIVMAEKCDFYKQSGPSNAPADADGQSMANSEA